MNSSTKILWCLLLSIVSLHSQFGTIEGCKISESSILFNFHKGDNVITKLLNKFGLRKTDDCPSNTDETFHSMPSFSSWYNTQSMPAEEAIRASYQYFYIPYSPNQLEFSQYIPAPLSPQNSYPSFQFWPTVSGDKEINISKGVSVLSDKESTPLQSQSSSDSRGIQSTPIYTTSILINNEPKQMVPPLITPSYFSDAPRNGCNGNCHQNMVPSQQAPSYSADAPQNVCNSNCQHIVPSQPTLAYSADAPQNGCNGNCHQHTPSPHHNIPPYTSNNDHQPNPPHPIPEYTISVPPAPPVIPSSIHFDTRFNVNVSPPVVAPRDNCNGHCPQHITSNLHHNLPLNPNNDGHQHNLPHPTSEYTILEPPGSSAFPSSVRHDTRSDVNVPLFYNNNETKRYPYPPNYHYSEPHPVIIQEDINPRQPFIADYRIPTQFHQDQSYSTYSMAPHPNSQPPVRYEIIHERQPPAILADGHPRIRYDYEESSPPRMNSLNEQLQPTIIEREKTSSIILETQIPHQSDIPDTMHQSQPQRFPPRVESRYRLVSLPVEEMKEPSLYPAVQEIREKKLDLFTPSKAFAPSAPKVYDSSIPGSASADHFGEIPSAKLSFKSSRQF